MDLPTGRQGWGPSFVLTSHPGCVPRPWADGRVGIHYKSTSECVSTKHFWSRTPGVRLHSYIKTDNRPLCGRCSFGGAGGIRTPVQRTTT